MGMGGKRHDRAALSQGKKPGTHFIGGWSGPRAVLKVCGKPRPHRDSIPGPSNPGRVCISTTLSRPTNTTAMSHLCFMFTEESYVHPSVVVVQVLLFASVADYRHSLLHKDRRLFGKQWNNLDHVGN